MSNKYQEIINLSKKNQDSEKSKGRQILELQGHKFNDDGDIIVDLIADTNKGKKNFGKVTYDAYKAIEGNTLDSYKPKNDEEKKVLDGYKQYTGMLNPSPTSNSETTKEDTKVDWTEFENQSSVKTIKDKYGLNVSNITYEDMEKWAKEHNFTFSPRQDNSSGNELIPKKDGLFGMWGKELPTEEEKKDAETILALYELSLNKKRNETSQSKVAGSIEAGSSAFVKVLPLGEAAIKKGDEYLKKKLEDVGIDSKYYSPESTRLDKVEGEHPVASTLGTLSGLAVEVGAGSSLLKGTGVKSAVTSSVKTYKNILTASKTLGATKGAIRAAKLARTLPTIMTMATPAVLTYNRQNSKGPDNVSNDVKDTPLEWLEKQVAAGNAQYSKGLASSLDLILPTEAMGKYDLISKVNDFYGDALLSTSTEAQQSSSKLGKGWATAGEAVQVVTAALPNSITALFLAGANVPGQAVQFSKNKTINAVANYLTHTAKNPQYWTSVLQTLGTDYEEAKSRGANDAVATAYAVFVTAVNAGIELGGFQALPDKLMGDLAEDTAKKTFAKGFFDWLTSSFEEGGEEVLQSFVSNVVAKIFDHETKWVSKTDDKAVVNLSRTAKEFGLGMFAGMVLSGGQIAAVETINRGNISRVGNYMQDFKDEVIAIGLKAPQNTESYKIAQRLSNKKGKVSDYELGKLHIANTEQFGSVYVGDKFKDTKTGNTFTIVNRDETNTTVELETPKGTQTREFGNNRIDNIVASGQVEKIMSAENEADELLNTDMSEDAETVAEANEEATTESTDIEKVVADYIETEMSEIEYDLKKISPSKNIFAGTRSGYVRTLSDGTYESGTYGEGSGAFIPNENIVRSSSLEEALSAQYKYMLENSNEDISKTIQKHLNNYNKRHTTPEEVVVAENATTPQAPSKPTTKQSVVVNKETLADDFDISDVVVSEVVNAIEETLKPDAKESIYKAMERKGYKGDLVTFAKGLRKSYKKSGTLGAFADFFTDGGAKVVSAIEGTLNKTETVVAENETTENVAVAENETTTEKENTTVTEEVLKNQSQSDTINADNVKNTPATKQGNTTAYTNDNQKIDLLFKVVSVDDLIVSNSLDGKVNPNYPQELQPRDRSRVSSQSQIRQMANTLNPARLEESTSVADGSPIVGSDNVVESGNGRTLAIELAYKMGTADEYINYIINNAEKFDIDVSNLPENPVLVRERLTEVDRVEFTRKANESSISSLSATEQARVDAENLTEDVLNLLVSNDEGIINTADNQDFISAVISKVFKNEDLNNVVGAEGRLSARGLERITNAIFYKAYGDISLSVRLSESLDNDMKNATKVLLNVAPKVVVIKNGIVSEQYYNFNFAEDIASAVRLFEQCRNKNETVLDYANQTSFLEKQSPLVMAMAYVFETKNRGAKQATDFYNLLLDTVIEMGNPLQVSMGTFEVFQSKEEILNATLEKFNNRVEPKNTITIPESVFRLESTKGRDYDSRRVQTVPGDNTSTIQEESVGTRIQQDNGQSEETRTVSDDKGIRETDSRRKTEQTEVTEVEQQKEETQYNVAFFENLGSDIRKGENVSLEEVRTAVDVLLLNNGESLKAELSQLKNDELKKRISIYDRGRITKKAEMVNSIYSDMITNLYYAISGKDTITYIYDGSGIDAQQSKMLLDVLNGLTEENFGKQLANNAEKYKKQLAEREEKLSKVKKPQTLEDFAYKKRYFGLSDEETIQYENLYAEERKKTRESKKETKTTKDTSGAETFFANADNYTIEKTTHTKTGEEVWVVRPASRLETEEWKNLNEQMKALGGSYWRGNQGWNFKKDPTATLPTEETDPTTIKGSTNAEKLRAVAEGMQKAIDDKFKDRLTNTAKRAREAASAEAEGERLKRLQDTINNIAEALENGEDTLLDKIDSKAQVETLMSMLRTSRRNKISETLSNASYDERSKEQDKPYSIDDAKYAEYPLTKLHENIVSGYLRAAEGKTGYKQISDRLKKAIKNAKNGYVTIDTQLFSDIDKIVKNLSPFYEQLWNDGVAERKRLARMGIENVVELRAYLRDFINFLPGENAEAKKQRTIKEKERQLANAKIEGFFPTPKVIVEKMLDEADIKPNEKVLEPSAGKGNIADEIKSKYPDNSLDVIEWNSSLNELLTEKGHNVVGEDFLKASGNYDKIVMNPPFEKGQDIDHIRHAYSLLNEGGRVVCIMSEGPFYRSDKKATEFREWLDEVGGVSEKLPEGSFKNSERSTGVNTRLVVIDKITSKTPNDGKRYSVATDDFNILDFTKNTDVRYSIQDYAPTFYSKMGKVVADIKQEKLGANSVVSYLKGKGVKNEEIKWSGIEEFLEGKKSVTKAELQEFVEGSMLQIEETVLDGSQSTTLEIQEVGQKDLYVMRGGKIYDSLTWLPNESVWMSDAHGFYFDSMPRIRSYYGVNESGTRWGDYALKGGENYREITFKMPNSDYSNYMMETHWGENAKGILAHARIQDFEVDGKKMLFVEEIQSDWHNQGQKMGYIGDTKNSELYEARKRYQTLENEDNELLEKMKALSTNISAEEKMSLANEYVSRTGEIAKEKEALKQKFGIYVMPSIEDVPDAPFRDNYHEYVLKRLIRMAAEQGYDSIGWTTAETQSKRWSANYAEGYRIEYDQEIPKFLNKYGKKWGAKVGRDWLTINEDLDEVNVWSMPITEAMKDSVLYEGQTLYSLEKEGNSNEQREDLLSGNGRRANTESAGKQAERISEFKQKNKGKTRAERQSFAKELLAKGQTEEVIDGRDKYNLVKPEAYNDEMLSIVEDAKKRGKEVGFFVGEGKLKFDTKGDFKVNGIKVSDTKVLIRYDGDTPPQLLYKHEDFHTVFNTPEGQEISNTLDNSLTEEEKQNIFEQDRYAYYKEIYDGDMDSVWEEFVCDVMAGMNEYSIKHIDTVYDYWYGGEIVDRFKVSEYTDSIDAGGQYRLPESGGLNGFEQNSNSKKLGQLKNSSKTEGYNRVGEVGHSQSQKTNTPHTKKVHRSGVSAETITSSGLTAEQTILKAQNKIEGIATEFYVNAKENGTKQSEVFVTDSTIYYPDADFERSDLSINNGIASFTEKRFNDLIEEYSVPVGGQLNRDYAKAYVAYISPSDFLSLTTVNEQRIIEDTKTNEKYGNGKIDIERLSSNTQTPFLEIDFEDGVVTGHEGRHRMVMLREAGIERVAIVIKSINPESGKYSTKKMTDISVTGQEFSIGTASGNVTLDEIIPLSPNYRNEVREKFVDNDSDLRYSLEGADIPDFLELWEEYVSEYGVIPKGENPVRDVDVPQKISEKDVVSHFARTMIEAGVTPDWAVSEFEKAIVNGEMTHEVITNKKAQDWATKQIKYHGFEDALNQWSGYCETGEVGKKELALGMELYNQCINNKDVHNAMKIAAELAAEATRAGQTLQACRMLKLMTPDGQLYYLEKSVQKMNEEFKDKLGEKFKDIKLDENLMEDFINEKDETKRNELYDKICQDIADQIPATMLDKWNSWRYLAMLGNPRTHMRNILGNAVFVPSVRMKNYVGAIIEKAVNVPVEERVKSLHKTEESIDFAEKDFEEMVKVLQGENAKYAVTSDIEGKRRIFKTEWLEKARLKNFEFLEAEDMWFLKLHYVDALARLITVRNLDVKSIDKKTLEKIRTLAVKEAQAATYRDSNSIAEGLNALQKNLGRSNNKAKQFAGLLIEGVMPFKKTPMNIAKQGISYSPIGILQGTYKAFTKLKNGTATTSEVIDDFSKGLTGTGMMLLGLFLAKMGLLVGAGDKPDKEREFDKMVGEQDYSLNIGDWSYTIDWATPSNLSLFIGAELYNLTKDEFRFADIVSAVSTITEPLLELSVFNGVNGVIETAQYSEGSPLIAIGSDMATSYFLQALPTIGGQISRITDGNKREYYYVDNNKNIPKGMQRLIGQASSKIPFASHLFEVAVDEWGREETYGNTFERVAENLISPGYYSEENYTDVDRVIKDLYDKTGETSVLPITQQKYYEEDYVRYDMTAEEYTEAKKMRGQKSFEYVSELLADKKTVKLQNKATGKYRNLRYSQMTDEEKVRAIKRCYEEAGDETKATILEKIKTRKATKK